jgi:hypothetical protein
VEAEEAEGYEGLSCAVFSYTFGVVFLLFYFCLVGAVGVLLVSF